jgi:hypothetical protein
VTAGLGVFTGFGGPEHGYFEMLQGHVKPDGLFISAMGPPCDPGKVWHLCEPAMTVVPSFLITGILATVIGLFTMVWSGLLIQRKHGGTVLILLSIALLLFGGGLVPPVIGMIAGVLAGRINAPLTSKVRGVHTVLARLWPATLIMFFVLVLGQFVVGHLSNEIMIQAGFLIPLLILGFLGLSIVSAHAHDVMEHRGVTSRPDEPVPS